MKQHTNKPLKPDSDNWRKYNFTEDVTLKEFVLFVVSDIETNIQKNEFHFNYKEVFELIKETVDECSLSFSVESLISIKETLKSLEKKYQHHLELKKAYLERLHLSKDVIRDTLSKEMTGADVLQSCIKGLGWKIVSETNHEIFIENYSPNGNPEEFFPENIKDFYRSGLAKFLQPETTPKVEDKAPAPVTPAQFFQPEATSGVNDKVPASAQASTTPAQSVQQASSTLPNANKSKQLKPDSDKYRKYDLVADTTARDSVLFVVRDIITHIQNKDFYFNYKETFKLIEETVDKNRFCFSVESLLWIRNSLMSLEKDFQQHLELKKKDLRSSHFPKHLIRAALSKEMTGADSLQGCIKSLGIAVVAETHDGWITGSDNPEEYFPDNIEAFYHVDFAKYLQPETTPKVEEKAPAPATPAQFFQPETTSGVNNNKVPASAQAQAQAQASTTPAQSVQQASSTLPTTSQEDPDHGCDLLWGTNGWF